MSTGRVDLSVRKEFLVAQSALYRAQLKYEVVALRSRVADGAGWFTRAFTIFSIVRSLVSIFRK